MNMQANIYCIFVIVTRTVALVCDYENSVELTNRTYNGIKYEDGEYFVDKTTGVERGCVCMKETCMRKCCPIGQAYDMDKRDCVDFLEEFNPPVREEFKVKPGFNASKEFYFLINRMNCSEEKHEYRIAVGSATPDYHLKTDGKLYVTMEDNIPSHIIYAPDKYCVDNFISVQTPTEFNGLICFVVEETENYYALNSIYSIIQIKDEYSLNIFDRKILSQTCAFILTIDTITTAKSQFFCAMEFEAVLRRRHGMLISCFFILLTVAVYAFLPELRTLHGMVMTSYLMSFFVAFLFLAAMDIMLLMENINQTWCTSMTFVIYFSWLVAVFWLNVMCYDLWSKFRITNMVHGFAESKRVRYLKYCAYAFGVPTALTILLAGLEFSDLPADIKLLPHLRWQGCFINDDQSLLRLAAVTEIGRSGGLYYVSLITGTSKLLYLYTPIILLCVANLVFFLLTARRIAATKKQTQMLNKKDTQRFSLYIKLFIVTGINWILEVISAVYPQVPYLWQVTDAYNILVGLTFFVIFVCKKKIWLSIKIRFNQF